MMGPTPYINPVVDVPLKRAGNTWSIDPELLGQDTNPEADDYAIIWDPGNNNWKYVELQDMPTSGEHTVVLLAPAAAITT